MKQDREAVRTLAIQVGVREAARRLNLNENTVMQWSSRYQWFKQPTLPPTHNDSKAVSSVSKPAADALLSEITENGKATKLSLSRYAKRAAQDSEQLSTREAPLVHKVAQVAQIVHPEQFGSDKAQTQFSLNILNVQSFGVTVGDT